MPYAGENLAFMMADAALIVLEAVQDAQEYLNNEGMLVSG
jgi:hypothetical protein